eukprot:COSAG05_NODE_11713_length_500_cov_1.104738_2_plen_60_part_01
MRASERLIHKKNVVMHASERAYRIQKKFSRVSAPDDDISAVLICDEKKKPKKQDVGIEPR